MVKIEFEGNLIQVPDKWEDIRLCDYESWFLKTPQSQNEQVEFVAAICKTDPKILLEAPVEVFNIIMQTISFIFRQEFEPANRISIGGTNYSIAFSDELTLGEYVDIDQVTSSDSTTKVSDILAIVCRPAGEAYDANRTEERRELFRNLTCDKVLPLITFFLRRKQDYEMILHHYSKVVEEVNRFVKDTKTFVQNGVGIKSLPIWQRIKYYILMRSFKKKLSKFSAFSSISKTASKPKKTKRIF